MNWEQFGYLCRINSSAQLSKSDKLRLSEKASLSIYQGDNDDSELAKALVAGVVSQDEIAAQKSATYYQCLPKLINDFKFEHKGWLVYLTFVFAFFLFIFSSLPTFCCPCVCRHVQHESTT